MTAFCKVVVLVGDEKQRKMARDIQDAVTRSCEGCDHQPVRLNLIAPCWAKSWDQPLRHFERVLNNGADAAVIGTYVPTELGKAARRASRKAGIPHFGTGAKGRSGLASQVVEAAHRAIGRA